MRWRKGQSEHGVLFGSTGYVDRLLLVGGYWLLLVASMVLLGLALSAEGVVPCVIRFLWMGALTITIDVNGGMTLGCTMV